MAAAPGTYFDSALIGKFYLNEPGRDVVRELARSSGRVVSCSIAVAEISAAFHRKLREGAIEIGTFRALQSQFSHDLRRGLWTLVPASDALIGLVHDLFAELPSTVFLRSLDALHLVAAKSEGFREVHSNDRDLILAAGAAGLRGINPLD
jgi:predicted nucleic acid-binding protein